MSAAIDYLANADAGGVERVGIREQIEMDQDLIAGERIVSQIAEDLGVSVRTVQRRRAKLKALGLRLPPSPGPLDNARAIENHRAAMRRRYA